MDWTSHRVRFRHLTEGEVKADLEMPHLGKEEYKGWIVFPKKIIKIRNRVEEFEGNVGQFLGGELW